MENDEEVKPRYTLWYVLVYLLQLAESIFVIGFVLFLIGFFIFGWIDGIVVAKGFWQTLCAIFPFYAYYLSIEHIWGLLTHSSAACN